MAAKAARMRHLKRAYAGIDKSAYQSENVIFKTIDRDQAAKTQGKPVPSDAGRYKPNKVQPKVPCYVEIKPPRCDEPRCAAFIQQP